jgi:anti-anti-sigma factor
MVLQGDLDLFSIQSQWESLRSRLTSPQGPLVLDLNGIGDIDLSGIQLLLALEQQASAQGIALSLAGVKQEWIDRFRPLGLARLLEDHS